MRFLSRRAAQAVAELNPVVTHRTDEGHLRSAEFQLGALRYREDDLTTALAGRLRHRIKEGMDSFDAINDVQDHLLVAAQAHIERVLAESFAETVETVDDGPLRDILATLRDLFALWRIHEDRGWFLAHGVLAANKARAVRDLVRRLCRELRPHAVALVDGFGIPESVLGAPIATSLPSEKA